MLDEEVFLQHKRRRARRWDVKSTLGTVLCGLALVYLASTLRQVATCPREITEKRNNFAF